MQRLTLPENSLFNFNPLFGAGGPVFSNARFKGTDDDKKAFKNRTNIFE